ESVVRESAGITLTGTYHFAGALDGDAGGCSAVAYVRVADAGPFGGLLPILLWVLLGVVVVGIGVVSWSVARSVREARRARRTTDTVTTTGGTATVQATSGSIAAVAEQSTGEPAGQGGRQAASGGARDPQDARGASREGASSRARSGPEETTRASRSGAARDAKRDTSRDAPRETSDGRREASRSGTEAARRDATATVGPEPDGEAQESATQEPENQETVPVFIDRDEQPHPAPVGESSAETQAEPAGESDADDDTRETRCVDGEG
ncbi:MAG: hypothetical protein ACK5IM_06990, partial [Demequina sp.]|uniref:hypothetical protein n=1 Tax=Demequina sp. TaxID=2050685 RepID=UPI003A87E4B0